MNIRETADTCILNLSAESSLNNPKRSLHKNKKNSSDEDSFFGIHTSFFAILFPFQNWR